MEASPELIIGIASLVYATGLALFRLPLIQLRRWGWALVMHSWSSVAVFAAIGSLMIVRSYVEQFLAGSGSDIPLTATFKDAIASATASRDMAFNWIKAINLAALALGAIHSIMLIAFFLLAALGGIGIILGVISSFLISTVFALFAFLQKILSGVVLFMEGVLALVLIAEKLAPILFILGIVLFALPFARKVGKTFLVLGAALAIALPPAIVMASPPPGEAGRSIREAADIQALSIASQYVADIQGGVRYTAYDRENKTLWYPYIELTILNNINIDRGRLCADLPPANMTCDQLVEIIREMLKTPDKMILDTGGQGYYDAYNNGVRTTLTDNATYSRKVWFLNMWVTLHDTSPKNVTAKKIPKESDPQMMQCTNNEASKYVRGYTGGTGCPHPYIMWKERWESFWQSTSLYNEMSQWMVSANRNTTFVWFTKQPWGTKKEDLNIYGITLPKVKEVRWRENETYTCETDGNSSTVETCWRWKYYTKTDYAGNKSVYFVYLNMPDYQVCRVIPTGWGDPAEVCETRHGTPSWSYQFIPFTSNPPAWNHTVRDSSFQEIQEAGFIDGYGPYTLPQSIQAVNRNEPLTLEAPTEEKKVFVTANQTIVSSSYDGHPEHPDSLSYRFRVIFTASDSMPYLPPVTWEQLEDDKKYVEEISSGGYIPNNVMNVNMETFREEWRKYRPFEQGLYRDGPTQEAQRRLNQKFLEYKDSRWRENQTIFGVAPVAPMVSKMVYDTSYGVYGKSRGSNIGLETLRFLINGEGAVGVLKPISELIGSAFAMGIALALFAITVDTIQALVGGQSVLMGLFMRQIGKIGPSVHFFSRFMPSVQRMSRVNLLGRIMARMQENRMLKTAIEMRKHDQEKWAKIAKERVQRMRENRIIGINWRSERDRVMEMEKKLDRLEQLEKKSVTGAIEKKLLEHNVRSYVRDITRDGLRTDTEFQKSFRETHTALLKGEKTQLENKIAELKKINTAEARIAIREIERDIAKLEKRIISEPDRLASMVKQDTPVRMSVDMFGKGMAEAIKSTDGWERVALADTLSRESSQIGSSMIKSVIATPFGIVSAAVGDFLLARGGMHAGEGHTFRASLYTQVGGVASYIGHGLDDINIRAPAWVAMAAQYQHPFSVEGVRPTVYPAPNLDRIGVGVWTGGLPSAEIPFIKDPLVGGDVMDVADTLSKVNRYCSIPEIEKTYENLANYMEIYAKEDPGFNLSDFLTGRPKDNESIVFSVDKRVEGYPEAVYTVEYDVKKSGVDSFVEWLESQKDVIGFSVNRVEVSPEDVQPFSNYVSGYSDSHKSGWDGDKWSWEDGQSFADWLKNGGGDGGRRRV